MSSRNPEITDCAERDDREGILRCLANGYPIDEQRRDGRSALLVACINGCFNAVKLLVENNANIFLKNNKGSNAISHAAYKNHYEIVDYLVTKGVNANECDSQGRNALHMACSQGANETVLYLLHNKVIKDINAKTNEKKDALLLSIEGNCSVNTVLELLVCGADVLTHTTDNRNVLMECAKYGRTNLFHVLYRYTNINVNVKDAYDNCCIHYACENGNLHIIKALLHRGAFVKVRNKKGKSPIDCAEENGHEDCVKILQSVSSPPAEPKIESVLLSNSEENAVVVTWGKPRIFNYYPAITAIEVQLKQQRLFDQWKTIGTIQMGDSPFKEKPSRMKISFENGELTDIESDSDLDERNEVEMCCLCMEDRQDKVDKRMELNNQENVLPRFYVIKELSSSTKYSVRVRLANKYGWGNYSNGFNFCIKEIYSEFNETNVKLQVPLRSSIMIKELPSLDEMEESGSSSMMTKVTEVIEKQQQVKVVTPVNSTEMLSKLLSEGKTYLDDLIKDGVDLSTIRNNNGMSLLHAAAASTSAYRMELIKEVVQRNLLSINDRSKNGSIPLHFAIYNNNLDVAMFLIENQSDLTATDSTGFTPFLMAADRGNLQICQLLMERLSKESTHVVDKLGRDALVLAINSSHLHVADYLIQDCNFDPAVKLPPPHGWNLLYFAVHTKNDSVVKYCLEKGVSPCEEDLDGMNAIDYSRDNGTDQITSILEFYSKTPDSVDLVKCQTMFSQAVLTLALPPPEEVHPLFELVKVEVSFKKNTMLSTSLVESVAVTPNCQEVTVILGNLSPETQYKCKIRCFNKNGPSKWKSGFDFVTKSEEEDTVIPKESENHERIVETGETYSLVNQMIKRIEMESRDDSREENEIIQLIDKMDMTRLEKVSPETVKVAHDSFNLPCLHHLLLTASCHKEEEVKVCVLTLLHKQCDINEGVSAIGLTSLTPMDCACIVGEGRLIPFLIANNATFNQSNVMNLPACVFYSLLSTSPAPLQMVISETRSNLHLLNKRQSILSLLATIHKYTGVDLIAEYLLKEGLSKDSLDINGDSLLHTCVTHNNILLLSYLLKCGANSDIKNSRGKTPFEVAEENGNGEVIGVFMNSYRCPLPLQSLSLTAYNASTLLLYWSNSSMPAEVPAIDSYEIELINTNTNMVLLLPQVKTTYCFVDIPACYHMWMTARVRCHNKNGWSEWSSRGLFVKVGESLHNNDYYTWFVCHDCEEGYELLKNQDCLSLDDYVKITVDQIKEMNVSYRVQNKLIALQPMAVDDIKNDYVCLADNSKSHFSWFKNCSCLFNLSFSPLKFIYDSNMDTVKEVFSDSDESDDLDIGNIAQAASGRSLRDIYVTEDNNFHVSKHSATIPEKTQLLRLPAAFGIQTKPYDKSTYSEEAELQELAEKKRLTRSEALIRWRWKKDDKGKIIRDARGKPIRESNARIVKWSDGTYQLLIGEDNVFDIRIEDNKDNSQYVAAIEKARNDETQQEEVFFHIQSHLEKRILFQPRQVVPVPKSILDTEVKGVNYELNDPIRATRRRTPGSRNHAVKNQDLDRGFLEEDEDDENNIAAIKMNGKAGRFHSGGYDDYGSYGDDDYE